MALHSINYPLYHNAHAGEYNLKENLDSSGTDQIQIYRGEIYDFGDESYPVDIAEIAKYYFSLDDLTITNFEEKGLLEYNQTETVYNVAYSPTLNRYVVSGGDYVYLTSDNNGKTWTRRTQPVIRASNLDYSHRDDMFLWMDRNLFFYRSANGLIWTQGTNTGNVYTNKNVSFYQSFNLVGQQLSGKLFKTTNGATYEVDVTRTSNIRALGRMYNSAPPNYYSGWVAFIYGGVINYSTFDILNITGTITVPEISNALSLAGVSQYWYVGMDGYILQVSTQGLTEKIVIYDESQTWGVSYSEYNRIVFGSNQGIVAYSNSPRTSGWKYKNIGSAIIDLHYTGTTIIVLAVSVNNSGFRVITIDTTIDSAVEETGLVKDIYIDNNPSTYTLAYDYNKSYISNLGDSRLTNDPILNKIVLGQNLCVSVQKSGWTNNASISINVNGNQVLTQSSILRSFNYWIDTNNLSVNYGNIVDINLSVGSDTFTESYEVVENCKVRHVVYYVNKYGGIDSLPMEGNTIESYANDQYQINGAYDRSEPSNHQRRTIQNTAEKRWQMTTGLLTDDEASRIDHLLLSPKLWVHDLSSGLQYAAIITDSSFTVSKFRDNTRFVTYTFNLIQSQDIIRRG